MIECLCIVASLVVITLVAVFLLAWRDRRRCLRRDNARSVGERIEETRELAASAIEDLPKVRSDLASKYPDKEKAWAWVDPVIEFYRRLETLASSRDTTAQEAIDLANEAGEFLRQRKVKGVVVADVADRLASLIQTRDSAT